MFFCKASCKSLSTPLVSFVLLLFGPYKLTCYFQERKTTFSPFITHFFFCRSQYGISGPYWYAGGATIQVKKTFILFKNSINIFFSDHLVRHLVHHAQDQGPRSKDVPAGHQGKVRDEDSPGEKIF